MLADGVGIAIHIDMSNTLKIKRIVDGCGAAWRVIADGKIVRTLHTKKACEQWKKCAEKFGLDDKRLYDCRLWDGQYQ